MNKEKALDKLNKLIQIVQSLPDGVRILHIDADGWDDPRQNGIQLSNYDGYETPAFTSSRPHSENEVHLYTKVDGFEVFTLKDKPAADICAAEDSTK